MKDLDLLEKIEMLSSLDDSEIGVVYSMMKKSEYGKGISIFSEGDSGNEMYIITRGGVSISVNTSDGNSVEIAVIGEGNFFGEMSIFDDSPRSAGCVTREKTTLLAFSKEDFFDLMEKHPCIAIKIMRKMLAIITGRLQNTGAFLSDMVTWGESARKRAVTDEFTGLYNRRFLDNSLEDNFSKARMDKKPLSLVMADLDNFGKLNKAYGEAAGDEVILSAVKVFRSVFREKDILARYGGDEFTFILPETGPEEALSLCKKVVEELRKLTLLEKYDGNIKLVTSSMGTASYPEHADSVSMLREKTDRALYLAKERGRNMAVLYGADNFFNSKKTGIRTIAEKNRIVCNLITLIESNEKFLLMGHRNPDEDCVASMVAFSLILGKMSRTASILLYREHHHRFPYLINICKYNAIEFIETENEIKDDYDAVIVLDTPKPSMLEGGKKGMALVENSYIPKAEIDHHLEADSGHIGDREYSLVDEASSTCELIGYFALKLSGKKDCLEKYQMPDLFSRNFVLAVITGMISDSGMGKYLKTNRERWFYNYFSSLFNELLMKKTNKSSGNFSTMKDIFNELEKLSDEEDECFRFFMARKGRSTHVCHVILTPADMDFLYHRYEYELIITVSRYTANMLAEESGFLSFIAYPDSPEKSDLVQFRMRRAEGFTGLDLRDVLEKLKIENGGGHPGAVGFRIEKGKIEDVVTYSLSIVDFIEETIPSLPGKKPLQS